MDRVVRQTAKRLLSHLPRKDSYGMEELQSCGFPPFLVRKIQVEIEHQLEEVLVLPDTGWADLEAAEVQKVWHQLKEAVMDEARLPVTHTKVIVETAVATVLKTLVQPSKNIPDLIFGEAEKLSYDQISNRLKWVAVYKHFGQIILRYMQKKEIEELSRERFTEIMLKADHRLTGQYSPLNWAQLLDPLFVLLDNKVESRMLRYFFDDKKRPEMARRFDLINEGLSRAEFIEALSAVDTTDSGGDEKGPSLSFDNLPHMKEKRKFEKFEEKGQAEHAGEGFNGHGEMKKHSGNDEAAMGTEKKETNIDIKQEDSEKGAAEAARPSLNAVFAETAHNKDEMDRNTVSGEEQEDDSDREKNTRASFETAEEEIRDGLNDEIPMWMRFFNEEDHSEEAEFFDNEEPLSRDTFNDSVSLKQQPPLKEERDALLTLLSKDQALFVNEIFGGSEEAFDEAVRVISTFGNWQGAVKYIEKEIFKRNLVNIYSEPAVNFTDRLQNYFLEKQNRN